MTADTLSRALGARRSGSQWLAKCPGHDDSTASLAVRESNGKILLHCHAGCPQEDVIEALKGRGLWDTADAAAKPVISAEYGYTDEHGELLYEVVRYQPKNFKQRYPDGNDGWIWKKGPRQVLYRLPEVLAAPIVFVVEGEKDCDSLRAHRFTATTSAGGANAPWLASFTESLADREVVLIPDNDGPGRRRVLAIAKALIGKVQRLTVTELPAGKDVSDWFALGHDETELAALVEKEPEIASEADISRLASRWDGSEPRIYSVSDIESVRKYAAQKIEFLVSSLIAERTVTLITGDSGSGKSTIVTAIGSAVERGAVFAGLETQRRPVLFLDRENPLPIVVERLDRLGISDSQNFKIWGGWVPEESPAPWAPIVIEWVEACEAKPLIIVDSLVAFLQGEENSATEVRAYMQGFRKLADMGATVIILHHSGKADSAREYRGSSDIKASIDIGYHLANSGSTSELGTLRLRAFKARFSVNPEAVFHYETGRFRMDARAPFVSAGDSLVTLLRNNPFVSKDAFEDLAKKEGISRTRARDFLSSGHLNGTVLISTGERGAKFVSWAQDSPEGTL
ncbi:MAG TPA: AAA family ATPase [Bryobacteraceae bacterium]|jgi:hypothetical protein|nr:AAA family ATPase [Bryobacteraceae bacterium]